MKLSKRKLKLHDQAEEILQKEELNGADKEFVFENWHPAVNHDVTGHAVYFTPEGLASELAMQLYGEELVVLDLCAGIGMLSWSVVNAYRWTGKIPRIIAVEFNKDFVEVGKKLVPEAEWIQGNIFDDETWAQIDCPIDIVISNPPFGAIASYKYDRKLPADLEIVGRALDISPKGGIFILPSGSVPFEYSGVSYYKSKESSAWNRFLKYYPDVEINCCSIDTEVYRDEWRMANPRVELVDIRKAC